MWTPFRVSHPFCHWQQPPPTLILISWGWIPCTSASLLYPLSNNMYFFINILQKKNYLSKYYIFKIIYQNITFVRYKIFFIESRGHSSKKIKKNRSRDNQPCDSLYCLESFSFPRKVVLIWVLFFFF